MPIYAYQCSSCGHEMEVLQKLSDPRLTDCPQCHQATLNKKVTAAAFRLGGSGWYETDFKAGDKKNLASKDTATAEPSAPAATTTSTPASPAPTSGTPTPTKAAANPTKGSTD